MNRQEKLSEVLTGVKEVVEALYEQGYDSRAILEYMNKIVGDVMHNTLKRLDSLKEEPYTNVQQKSLELNKKFAENNDLEKIMSEFDEPKQQTVVEWLVSELKKYDSAGLKDQSNYVIEMPTHILTELEEQAKEMEKQKIIDAGNSCAFKQHLHSDRINKMSMDELEQYNLEPSYTFGEEHYNEKFNK